MPRPRSLAPKYRPHKSSGQAVVTIRGKDHYLGKHGSVQSQERYHQLLAEFVRPVEQAAAAARTLDREVYAKFPFIDGARPASDERDACQAYRRSANERGISAGRPS